MMIYFAIFMLGASIGSFCNVMLSRSDWYKGRSHCDSCGYILKWYDLIPVLSY
ncbi:MAG: prepilin peptidase, partial [Firmicutes bacterium]|nr:prepilin peptidase [Bacillota bacterium]